MNENLLWIIPVGSLWAVMILRLLTLIVSARSLRWSRLSHSATVLLNRSLSPESLSESGNFPPIFVDSRLLLEDSINDEISFGPTGFTPGGVSYTQVPQRGGTLVVKGRKRIRRGK